MNEVTRQADAISEVAHRLLDLAELAPRDEAQRDYIAISRYTLMRMARQLREIVTCLTQANQCKNSEAVAEWGLSLRCRRALRKAQIHSAEELTSKTAFELSCLSNFGPVSLQEVRTKLAERGLWLKGEGPPQVAAGT